MGAAVKAPEAYRSISEVSDRLQVPQHVLRFWETKFSFLRPMKRAGGRRLYRPQDIAILQAIHVLLHRDGYTIKGVQKLYRDKGLAAMVALSGETLPEDPAPLTPLAADAPSRVVLERLLTRLLVTKAKLDDALSM